MKSNTHVPALTVSLARQLIAEQFPQWSLLPIHAIVPGGWDHRTFRLGNDMLIRLPSAADYAVQVEKEQRWLPRLAPLLPLAVPTPLAMGQPSAHYPWSWSVYRWLPGKELAEVEQSIDMNVLAKTLGAFLCALQKIETHQAPEPGAHNFYRGGALSNYTAQVQQAMVLLQDRMDVNAANNLWQAAVTTAWQQPPVWVHGDISAGNLLMQAGKLVAVIDFGMMAAGDPAADLAIAWTFFTEESRKLFRDQLSLDSATWQRGCAWALWKALIIAAGITKSNTVETSSAWNTLETILASSNGVLFE